MWGDWNESKQERKRKKKGERECEVSYIQEPHVTVLLFIHVCQKRDVLFIDQWPPSLQFVKDSNLYSITEDFTPLNSSVIGEWLDAYLVTLAGASLLANFHIKEVFLGKHFCSFVPWVLSLPMICLNEHLAKNMIIWVISHFHVLFLQNLS